MEVDGRNSVELKGLVEKVDKKINSWKFATLNQARKLLLCNAILIALASHILSIFLLPKSITKKVQSSILRFLWPKKDSTPIYWVKKELITERKEVGGLGLRRIDLLNKALLCKQGCRMKENPSLLVSKIYKAKYGDEWFEHAREGKLKGKGSWAAKGIFRSITSFKERFKKRIGNGLKTNITEDSWLAGKKRKNQAEEKIRRWFDGDTAKSIFATDIGGDEDSLEWAESVNGTCSTRSGYKFLLENGNTPNITTKIDWELFWKDKILPKWKIFYWKIINNAVPVKTNLRKRGIEVPLNCSLCGKEEENLSHLFRDCKLSQRVWKSSWLGLEMHEKRNSATGIGLYFDGQRIAEKKRKRCSWDGVVARIVYKDGVRIKQNVEKCFIGSSIHAEAKALHGGSRNFFTSVIS
ncbi:hypothetical protein RDABS01_025771 [Bienertia sinuspersici]